MCTYGRWITNKYSGDRFFVKCGHCKSCLQEKAASRSSRIRNEYRSDMDVIFGTLTYDRLSCPYILQSDVDNKVSELNVYRAYSTKWNFNKGSFLTTWKPEVLSTIHVPEDYYFGSGSCAWLKKQPHHIGVCLFKDYQDFCKRLRINLHRYCNYDGKFKLYGCCEYGPKTQRPHFHFLLFVEKGLYQKFRFAYIKSWPFSRRTRFAKSFQQITDDPAGYVSSYVNSGNKLSPFLANVFPQKYSSSKFFGHGRDSFQLDKILQKLSTGDMSYTLKRITNSGEKILALPFPKYVIHRYFPLFKGSSRLSDSTVYNFLSGNIGLSGLLSDSRAYDVEHVKTHIDYTREDLHKISVRLQHAFEYYNTVTGRSPMHFAIDYQRVWTAYRSTVYKFFVQDDSVHPLYKYDNLCHIPRQYLLSVLESLGYNGTQFVTLNCNERPNVKNRTIQMTQWYDRYCKQKEISNFVMSENNECFV